MESKNVDVEIVIEDEMGLSDRPPRSASGSYSDSSPYVSDSEGEDFYDAPTPGDAQGKSNEMKERVTRKSSTIKLTHELKEKIIAQTELLFSDDNLLKDGFLLKHVRRNKDGFVNLKLLSSFKKMRSICKDYRVICEALKDSKLLELNEECSKIKRMHALPDNLFDQVPVRFIVVSNIKADNPSMDCLSDMFSNSGQIEGVRIVRPGKKFPSDLQSHFAHNPDLVKETVAVVEFESAQMAADIVEKGLPHSEKYGEAKLSLLHLSAKQLAKRTRYVSGEGGTENEEMSSAKEEEQKPTTKAKRSDRKKLVTKSSDKSLKNEESCPSSSDNDVHYSSFSSYRRRYNQETASNRPASAGGSPQSSPKITRKTPNLNNGSLTPDSSPNTQRKHLEKNFGKKNNGSKFARELKLSPLAKDASPMTSPELKHRHLKNRVVVETSSLPNSPWVMRRKTYNKDHNDNHESSNGNLNAFGLLRQPKGPDGSRGFLQQFKGMAIHA